MKMILILTILGLAHAQEANTTNQLNYPFLPYANIDGWRENGNQFLYGANSS